jgi:hypothetical protein
MVVADPASTRRLMRVDARPARVWHGRSASEAGAVALERYWGCYQFGNYVLEIRSADHALCAAWSWAGDGPPTGITALTTAGIGTPRALVHARDHTFIIDADDIDVSLTFDADGSSPARAVWCEIEQAVERGLRIPPR